MKIIALNPDIKVYHNFKVSECEFSDGLNGTWLIYKNNYTGVFHIDYDLIIIDLVFKKYVL